MYSRHLRWGYLWLAVVLGASACATGTPSQQAPECGDGVLQDQELCDDGNVMSGDGCDAFCLVESGYACQGDAPTVCTPVCGDNVIVAGENCDGADLSGQSCESLELGTGTLDCGPTCTFDTSGCSATLCGNGVRDSSEECEGSDLGGQTCSGLGYDEGSLACTTVCTYDTSGCSLASCGDGVIDGIEECDDGNSLPGDGCGANCAVEDGWTCTGEPSQCAQLCGNSTIDPGEECDGNDLGGNTCPSVNSAYEGGTLGCLVNCQFDTSLCEVPTCGNGALDPGEQCDGALLGGNTCQTVGAYIGGNLYCSPTCAFDLSSCVPLVCGDGILSTPPEACDDGNVATGDGCNAICQVETGWECDGGSPTTCTERCGNGLLDTGEACDGALLGGETCQSVGYDAGTLACDSACNLDTSSCYVYVCGNNVIEPGEVCDTNQLGGASCVSLGYTSGTLTCGPTCNYDTSGCITVSCGDGNCNGAEESCSCPQDCGTTCGDGCCNGTETSASCALDCGGCPGALVNGTCVYLANPNGLSLTQAQAECASLGAGWGVCPASILCDAQTLTYLGTTSCDCNLGATNCACGSAANLYIHTGDTAPYYIRTSLVANCDWAADACTMSGSETCGAALCCN